MLHQPLRVLHRRLCMSGQVVSLAALSVGCSIYDRELLDESVAQSRATLGTGRVPVEGTGGVDFGAEGGDESGLGGTCSSDLSGELGESILPIEPVSLRVMSYNIGNGTQNDGLNSWEYRWDFATSIVETYLPDVVGLQEVVDFQQVALEEQTGDTGVDYRSYGVARRLGEHEERATILYRADKMRLLQRGTFWLSDTPQVGGSLGTGASVPRVCSWAYFELDENRRRFYLYNTHLDDSGSPARVQGVEVILAQMAARADHTAPVLLTADLNAGERSAAESQLSANLTDTFRAFDPASKEVGTSHGFSGTLGSGLTRLDYIFADAKFTVDSAKMARDEREGKYPSDHFPVIADLRL